MATPKVWDSANDLVLDLQKDWNKRASKLSGAGADWESNIRSAVSRNTFRAFQNLPHRPSRVFREWALDALVTRKYFDALEKIRTQSDYDKWLERFVIDFRNCWKRRMRASSRLARHINCPTC
jgi:hypothetical protein